MAITERKAVEIHAWVWYATFAGIIALFIFDFFAHVRKPHEPTFKESAWWSAFYIGLAILFGFGMWFFVDGNFAGQYFAGFVTEKALSVDNLFVFVLIMASFNVPRAYQQKVLLVGIVIALVLRGIFIAVGAAAINAWAWIFYLFGAFLVYTAIKLVVDHLKHNDDPDENETADNATIRFFRKFFPTTEEYHSDRLTTKINGKRFITPMLLVMVAIGSTDILFALDSIPAIFGLTQEPYIVFTANAFALMGLRQLFFLLDGLLDRLVYLSYGLGAILAFIGVKLVFHALHENNLPFINGGQHVSVPEISIGLSLSVILGILVVTTVLSLTVGKKAPELEQSK
ncbi:TerC family protein [Micrococcales bacterium 31B]|nr:TerC family protein [Micrococcales bacterium 31B]